MLTILLQYKLLRKTNRYFYIPSGFDVPCYWYHGNPEWMTVGRSYSKRGTYPFGDTPEMLGPSALCMKTQYSSSGREKESTLSDLTLGICQAAGEVQWQGFLLIKKKN